MFAVSAHGRASMAKIRMGQQMFVAHVIRVEF